jgi:hypothetical protein
MRIWIKWETIKPILDLNICMKCNSIENLHECNACLELYCVNCDKMKYTWCNRCEEAFTRKLLKRKRERRQNKLKIENKIKSI